MTVFAVLFGAALFGALLASPVATTLPIAAGWIGAGIALIASMIAARRWTQLSQGQSGAPGIDEKLAWTSLVVTTLVSSYFVAYLCWNPNASRLAMFGNIAILQIGWSVVCAWLRRGDRGGSDERDRAVEARAYRYAYFGLVAYVGCLLWLTLTAWSFTGLGAAAREPLALASSALTSYALIGALLCGELINSLSRLLLYRAQRP